MKSRIITYSAWLVVVGALLIAPRLISVNNLVRLYHFAWLDVFATAALLFSPALLIASVAGGTLLALLENVTARSGAQRVRLIPACLIPAVFLAAWLHLLPRTLKINRIEFAWIDRPFELPAAVLLAGSLFALFPAGLAR